MISMCEAALGRTYEVNPIATHEEIAVAHERWILDFPRLWVRQGDLVVQVVKGEKAGVQVVHHASYAHSHDFVGIVIANVRSHITG